MIIDPNVIGDEISTNCIIAYKLKLTQNLSVLRRFPMMNVLWRWSFGVLRGNPHVALPNLHDIFRTLSLWLTTLWRVPSKIAVPQSPVPHPSSSTVEGVYMQAEQRTVEMEVRLTLTLTQEEEFLRTSMQSGTGRE